MHDPQTDECTDYEKHIDLHIEEMIDRWTDVVFTVSIRLQTN